MIILDKLTRGLSIEEKKEFIDSYKNGAWMLKRIRTVLEKDIGKLVEESESDSAYESPNYDEYQRGNIAERKALRKLIKLLPQEEVVEEEKEDG